MVFISGNILVILITHSVGHSKHSWILPVDIIDSILFRGIILGVTMIRVMVLVLVRVKAILTSVDIWNVVLDNCRRTVLVDIVIVWLSTASLMNIQSRISITYTNTHFRLIVHAFSNLIVFLLNFFHWNLLCIVFLVVLGLFISLSFNLFSECVNI